MVRFLRTSTVFALLALTSGAPPPRAIIHPLYTQERLIIPRESPVTFQGWDKSIWYARFNGRFTITGTLVYDCSIECSPDSKDEGQVYALIIPDRSVAARLPRWDHYQGAMAIYLTSEAALLNRVLSQRERAAVTAGQSPGIHRRVSIVVDQFAAAIECESALYTARFVAIAGPPPPASSKTDQLTGCGF